MIFFLIPLVLSFDCSPDLFMYGWLLAGIAFWLLELLAMGFFFFLAFGFGCMAAALLAFLGYSFMVQCTGSMVGGSVAFFLLRRSFGAKKVVEGEIKTALHGLIGKEGVVVEQVTKFKRGWVKVQGELWAAKTVTEETYLVGDIVRVIRLEGNHIIITRSYMPGKAS